MAKSQGAKVRSLIKDSGVALKTIMQEHLSEIADNMIDQVRINLSQAIPSQRVNAFSNIEPKGVQAYREDMLVSLAIVATEALTMARKEIPKAKNKKLEEDQRSVRLSEFDDLPPAIQKQLKQQAKYLVGTQLNDLEKNLFFQFDHSWDSTDSDEQVLQDLYDSADDYIKGVAITSGSTTIAGKIINDARNAFFFDEEVLQDVGAFEFYNGDPVSEICQDLAGTIFAKDDPNSFRYTPPLHFNCKSTILPIPPDDPRVSQIEDLKPSTKRIEDTIQFSEHNDLCNHSPT